MTEPTLAALSGVAREHRAWEAKRDRLVREAAAAGHSLRSIAAACGLSHSGVKRIIERG